jgi:outer membrane protein
MSMKKGILIVFIIVSQVSLSFSQMLITADDAVSIALKNSFNIMVARNGAEIAKLNNTPGNAGMLPAIAIYGSDNYKIDNTQEDQSSGLENFSSNTINAGAELNWTIFDGGKMFVTKNKLSEIESMGEIQFKDQVLETVYNVYLAYFNVVKQKQQLASIQKIIAFNKERVTILQTGFNNGALPKNNLLQAKIDLNVYLENAIAQENIILAAKRNLNQVLCRNIDSVSFDVIDSIPLNFNPDKTDLLQKIYANNTNILLSQKQISIAKLNIKEIKTSRLPTIGLHAGYNYMYTTKIPEGGNYSRSFGPLIGGTISIPIYEAGNISRQISTSKLQLLSAEYNFENSKIQVNTQVLNALSEYENQEKLLGIEQENAELVKENLEIAMQRLRLGQTTALEVRQAQLSYEDSFTRLINFKYNLKVAEIKLKQLMAEL